MFEQFGPLYWQLPANIQNPYNTTYQRLYRSLTDNLFYLRNHDGTEELFSTAILPVPAAQLLYSLYQDINTVGNIGAGQDVLYTDTIPAGTFAVNGDQLDATYSVTMANTLNAKTLRLSFGGINIFTSTNDYSTGTEFDVKLTASVIRVSATDAKVLVSYTANGITETQSSTITPLDWATAKDVVLTGEGVADNDVVANFAKGVFVPFATA